MKKLATLILSGATVLGIGSTLIFGNSLLSSKAMEEKIDSAMEVSESDAEDNVLVDTSMKKVITAESNETEKAVLPEEEEEKKTIAEDAMEEEADVQGRTSSLAIADAGDLDFPIAGEPGEGDFSESEAIEIAIAQITNKYDLTQETLNRFNVMSEFFVSYGKEYSESLWRISLNPTNPEEFSEIGCYMVLVDSATGEIFKVVSAADGVG